MTETPKVEQVEDRACVMLQDLPGAVFSTTTLRVATDWLKQEHRLATLTEPERTAKAVAEAVEQLKAENQELRDRGAQAIIAYHVAICSPKGVVPNDSFYDPVIADRCERLFAAIRYEGAGR